MNNAYKVVFNKARGALMVANEVTSSVQKKGTKTVLAAALVMLGTGVASAANTYGTVTIDGEQVSNVTEHDRLGDCRQRGLQKHRSNILRKDAHRQ